MVRTFAEWLMVSMRLLMALLILGWSAASLASVSVEVDGEGSTRYEAQTDALRQALQLVVRQLVIADREIREDRITIDRIYSSFNGYVEDFSIIKESREGPTSKMRVRVTVSESPILEFLRSQNSEGSAKMAGNAISAEISRELENRRFRDRLLARAFQGYPHSAVNVSVLSVRLDRASPDRVQMDVEYRLDSAFLAGLHSTARALSCKSNDPTEACTNLVCFLRAEPRHFDSRMWPRDDVEGLMGQSQCYRLQAGPMRTTTGYSIFDQFYGVDRRRFVLAALYLGADGQRIEGNAKGCMDGAFVVKPPVFASGQVGRRILWVAEYPQMLTLVYNFAEDLNRLGKLESIELIPTISEGRKLFADVLSPMLSAAGGGTTSFRPELRLSGGCFN